MAHLNEELQLRLCEEGRCLTGMVSFRATVGGSLGSDSGQSPGKESTPTEGWPWAKSGPKWGAERAGGLRPSAARVV